MENRIIAEELPIHQRISGEEIPIDLFPEPFPVGMKVLAVDDDRTSLRILEKMLQTCQYQVTTTTHALRALKMLQENKDKFDILISNVEMPEIDGFMLLEMVGIEMDIPVIMLSAHSETEIVMKGVVNGVCDYLLKPVRVLELKNIWQHVVRKKLSELDMINFGNSKKPIQGTFESKQGSSFGHIDQNGKYNRKMNDQYDDDHYDDEECEDGQENKDATQKKPRVVWSTDLHQKFLNAINFLGVDEATPKKILNLMNVDTLTRENVASHLQKYQLYMDRVCSFETHQANMMSTLHETTTTQLPNPVGSYTPDAMLGGLNTPTALSFNGISSKMVHPGHALIPNNCSLGHQNGNLVNGMPMSLELDQLQHNNYVSHIRDFSNTIDESLEFPSTSVLNQGTFEANVGVASQSSVVTNSSSTLEDLMNDMVKNFM